MTTAGIVLRWLHLAPALGLVGVFTALLVAGRSDRPTARAWEARLLEGARALAVLALLTGLGVLAHQAAHVAGRPAAAFSPADWGRVLAATQFGTVWLVRHALLLLLTAFVFFRERETGAADWIAFRAEGWLLVAAGAAALAWAGHAAAVEPWGLAAALGDALHLVGAGVWLGALLPLALLLKAAARDEGADSRPYAVLAIRRFSALALVTMLTIVATGLWSAWSQVGDVPALVGTTYGRLLALKVLLLVPVLALAAVNRSRLLPALGGDGPTVGRPAMARLGRRVAAEWALGLVILVVVSVLGTTPPARHDTAWWPFGFRLDYATMSTVPGVKTRLFIGSQIALLGVLGAMTGALLARWRIGLVAGGAAVTAMGLAVALPPLAVDAYPTTYRRPAVPYNAISIASGLSLYGGRCAVCHGVSGRGDGPGGGGLPRPPADLTAPHTGQHTAGDLFWWLSHGIPAGGMPGFGGELGEEERWDLINFVRALSAGEEGRRIGPVVEPDRPWLVAPDFSYAVGPGPGRALKDSRGRQAVLLVFFTLPDSRERLGRLARAYDTIRGLGAELLAIPVDGGERIIARLAGEPPILFPVVTEGSAEIVRAFALYARPLTPAGLRADAPMPAHAEMLIDRAGYLRARWMPGGESPGWSDPNALVPQLQALAREAPGPLADEHVH